jgi:hypothetical protein
MESLFILAAFTFTLHCSAPTPSIKELNFDLNNQCAQTEAYDSNKESSAEKINLAARHFTSKPNVTSVAGLSIKSLSPSVSLKGVSWMQSELADKYDPRLSLSIQRCEQRGMAALINLSIPL